MVGATSNKPAKEISAPILDSVLILRHLGWQGSYGRKCKTNTTYNLQTCWDGWMDTANKVCGYRATFGAWFLSLSVFFSVFIYALSDTFDLINFKLTPYIYSSAFLILHPTFGTLQSALSLSLLYRSACFDTDSSFISFAQHQIIFIWNFKMLLDINWWYDIGCI